jgi:hypothetical protein
MWLYHLAEIEGRQSHARQHGHGPVQLFALRAAGPAAGPVVQVKKPEFHSTLHPMRAGL